MLACLAGIAGLWRSMESPAPLFWIMTGFVAFFVGLSKGGLGGTLAALATPLMALVMPVDRVIGLVLPVLMLADVFAVLLHWKRWNGRFVILLLPGAIAGVTIGTLFITNAPTAYLRIGMGIIIVLFTLYRLLENFIRTPAAYQPHDWHGAFAGVVAGFGSSLAHIGGPPVSIYLLMQKVTPQVFIGTSAIFFMILNWIKVPYYFYADLFDFPLLLRIWWLMPLVPLGAWTGRWAADRINRQVFERVILVLLGITGLMLIFN
jgi:uncharacterized protein